MTTISNDIIGRVRAQTRQTRSPEDLAAARSRRFWAWTSTAWLTSVSVTAVVAAGDAVPVAIGGMTLAAVCNAMAHPEPSAAPSPALVPDPAPVDASPAILPCEPRPCEPRAAPMNGYGPGIKPL